MSTISAQQLRAAANGAVNAGAARFLRMHHGCGGHLILSVTSAPAVG